MTASAKQTAANRANALASTGPKTAAGKSRSATNALRHGLRSPALVVHGLEREADWACHLRGVLESVTPRNYLESYLAADVPVGASGHRTDITPSSSVPRSTRLPRPDRRRRQDALGQAVETVGAGGADQHRARFHQAQHLGAFQAGRREQGQVLVPRQRAGAAG